MVWNPIQSIINHKKTLSLLAAGVVAGGLVFGKLSYDCGVGSAKPITAQVKTSGYEKYPSLLIRDKSGREMSLFGISPECYFSGQERNRIVDEDLHKRRSALLDSLNKH